MLRVLFHAWERHLVSVSKNRVVRPFEWGLDWIPDNGHAPGAGPADVIGDWVAHVMADTDAFFTPPPTSDYRLGAEDDGEQLLTFPSAFETPHPSNNTVYCRYFPARAARLEPRPARDVADIARGSAVVAQGSSVVAHDSPDGARGSSRAKPRSRAAVLVLPQWNADSGGHVGLCRLLTWNGMSALRLSLPYHDQRMPPELT